MYFSYTLYKRDYRKKHQYLKGNEVMFEISKEVKLLASLN
ncbi:hypothetical protein EMIT091MI3_60244 [Kosakonia quasisacchari]